jgi:hypothetical protein
VRPKYLTRSFAKEIPVSLRAVGISKLNRLDRVLNFRREQITVLISDGAGGTFEMQVNPSTPLEAVRLTQAWIAGGVFGKG